MLAFLIEMSRLFELFVAEWLTEHLPPHLALRSQESLTIGRESGLDSRIYLALESSTVELREYVQLIAPHRLGHARRVGKR